MKAEKHNTYEVLMNIKVYKEAIIYSLYKNIESTLITIMQKRSKLNG